MHLSGNPGGIGTGPPTLRQVAQGRGELSRTTIKTFEGDAFGKKPHRGVSIPRQQGSPTLESKWTVKTRIPATAQSSRSRARLNVAWFRGHRNVERLLLPKC